MLWLENYWEFLLKSLTVFITIAGILILITRQKHTTSDIPQIRMKHYNNMLKKMSEHLQHTLSTKTKKKLTRKQKNQHKSQPSIFILTFKGDLKASQTKILAEEISVLLTIANPKKDTILLKLESPGGTVPGYGLAAAQLSRIKSAGIKLIVSIDQMAASGGYMMACIADHILAAPFAIVGSIGVVLQIPNINRLLKRHAIDFEQLTAGEHKRTLTLCGHNTHEGRAKAQIQIEETHQLFKTFIKTHRPKVNIKQVSTGEYWHASTALDFNLLDEISTSDEWMFKHLNTHQIYMISTVHKPNLIEKLTTQFTRNIEHILQRFNHHF